MMGVGVGEGVSGGGLALPWEPSGNWCLSDALYAGGPFHCGK